MEKYKKIINYIIFGVLTTIVNIFVFYILDRNSVDYKISTTIATIVSILFAYITNKFFVFQSYNRNLKFLIKEMYKFFISRIGTYFLDIIGMFIFIEIFHIENLNSKIMNNILVIIANYLLSKVYIFKEESE